MTRKTKFTNDTFLVHSTGYTGTPKYYQLVKKTKDKCGYPSRDIELFVAGYRSTLGTSTQWFSLAENVEIPARFLQGR